MLCNMYVVVYINAVIYLSKPISLSKTKESFYILRDTNLVTTQLMID